MGRDENCYRATGMPCEIKEDVENRKDVAFEWSDFYISRRAKTEKNSNPLCKRPLGKVTNNERKRKNRAQRDCEKKKSERPARVIAATTTGDDRTTQRIEFPIGSGKTWRTQSNTHVRGARLFEFGYTKLYLLYYVVVPTCIGCFWGDAIFSKRAFGNTPEEKTEVDAFNIIRRKSFFTIEP